MSMMLKFMLIVVLMVAYNSDQFNGPELLAISTWIIYLMASSFREIEDKAKYEKIMKYINAIYQRQGVGRPVQGQAVKRSKGGFVAKAKGKIGLGPKGNYDEKL